MGGEKQPAKASGPPKVKREIGESVKNFEARRAAAALQWKKDEEARAKVRRRFPAKKTGGNNRSRWPRPAGTTAIAR